MMRMFFVGQQRILRRVHFTAFVRKELDFARTLADPPAYFLRHLRLFRFV